MASQQLICLRIDFKTKKEISWRLFEGSPTMKDKYSKSSIIFLLKEIE